MEKAYFAKYNKNLSIKYAFKRICELINHQSTPIEFLSIFEYNCDRKQMEQVLKYGSLSNIPYVELVGIKSVQDSEGNWQCILLNDGDKTLIIFTGGTSDILYYSFKI